MQGYEVKIRESSKTLTAKERIAVKDFSNAIALDTAVSDDTELIINPAAFIILDVHNERSRNDKDYVKYLILDNAGAKYVTGSESFFTSFRAIFDEMAAEAPDEEYSIMCYRKASQNYTGKSFLTCSIA